MAKFRQNCRKELEYMFASNQKPKGKTPITMSRPKHEQAAQVADHVAEFLAQGGEIEVLESEVVTDREWKPAYASSSYTKNTIIQINAAYG